MNTFKNILTVSAFLSFATMLHALGVGQTNDVSFQSDEHGSNNQRRPFLQERMHPDDRFIITFFTDLWQDLPGEMDLKSIQRGINISAFQDMPLGRTNFSLAAGLEFASHNLYSDHRYLYHPGDDKFDFVPISDESEYDKNKISLNYLEIPVQFRYRSRELPRTFRLYAGMKVGRLINAHTKFVGKEYYYTTFEGNGSGAPVTSRNVKIKEHRLENISSYRIGLTGTIGYGSVNLHVFYPLTDIFSGNSAESARPVSLGLSFIVF